MMNRNLLVTNIAWMTMLTTAWLIGQGSLTPTGGPTPSMKTLDQIEARVPIAGGLATVTIDTPGSYYLTGNLNIGVFGGGGSGIVIATDGVSLDLNGFTIGSMASPADGSGIELRGDRSNIAIRNGHVKGTVTQERSVFTGGGFLHGVGQDDLLNNLLTNVRVSDLNVSGCLQRGVVATLVERSSVSTVGTIGIQAQVASHCVAVDCGTGAISGGVVVSCYGMTAAGMSNDVAISGGAVMNCSALSYEGTGIFGSVVQNSSASGGSLGLGARAAVNCYGRSSHGSGIETTVVVNGYGESGISGVPTILAGPGLKSDVAAVSFGLSEANVGIQAEIATSSAGVSGFSSRVSATHKYDMP